MHGGHRVCGTKVGVFTVVCEQYPVCMYVSLVYMIETEL